MAAQSQGSIMHTKFDLEGRRMTPPISRRDLLLAAAAGTLSLESLAPVMATEPTGNHCDTDPDTSGPFLVKPYVQMGEAPRHLKEEQIAVLWHAPDRDQPWKVEFRSKEATDWTSVESVKETQVVVTGIPPHRVCEAILQPLPPGAIVEYRVRRGENVDFTATTRSRAAVNQSFRCVVAGDLGTGSPQQRKVAYQIDRRQPEFMFVPGDLVYNHGRISEYRSSFYPVYSQEKASAEQGSPLMRSTILLGGRGQHDTQAALAHQPDAHAYFLYWSFPLNGPPLEPAGPHVFPLGGSASDEGAFREAAAKRFPGMANYSFDWGNSHWTVLDTWNPHIDWTAPALRSWLREDLARARDSTWKFVSSYMPPFSSSTAYPQGQKMRVIVDILQDAGVDIVFSGYAHSYQRTYPLRFTQDAIPAEPVRDPAQKVPGQWRLDKQFDGHERTRPDGILYIVSGCGGNPQLHSPEQTNNPKTWQPFTAKYEASTHQFTELEINDRRLTLRQISLDGEELDRISLSKP